MRQKILILILIFLCVFYLIAHTSLFNNSFRMIEIKAYLGNKNAQKTMLHLCEKYNDKVWKYFHNTSAEYWKNRCQKKGQIAPFNSLLKKTYSDTLKEKVSPVSLYGIRELKNMNEHQALNFLAKNYHEYHRVILD